MENQQPSHNQDEFEKLRSKNEELKKNLEREQVLHAMLYKEWKELDEKREAKEFELADSRPKNLFYKYAFYVILILLIPGFFFWNAQKNKDSTSAASTAPTLLQTDSTTIKDSVQLGNSTPIIKDSLTKTNKAVTTNAPEVKPQPAIQSSVEKAHKKEVIQQEVDTVKETAQSQAPLSDSVRENIYWIGWNAYYNKSPNHFKKSSQKYKAWIAGYNDGRNDAKKLLSKDSMQNKR